LDGDVYCPGSDDGALQFSILISEVPLSKIVNLEKTSLE
jgi:hypothetical protein